MIPKRADTPRGRVTDRSARAARSASPGRIAATVLAALALGAGMAQGQPETGPATGSPAVAAVPSSRYAPFYPLEDEKVHEIDAFEIQVLPVTNADYLAHWAGPAELGDADPDAPVTHVSRFAAGAYGEAQGMRLPSEGEWEVAARGGVDAGPAERAELLTIYARRSTLASADGRTRHDRDVARVCGGASLGARDVGDYPATPSPRHPLRPAARPVARDLALALPALLALSACGRAPDEPASSSTARAGASRSPTRTRPARSLRSWACGTASSRTACSATPT